MDNLFTNFTKVPMVAMVTFITMDTVVSKVTSVPIFAMVTFVTMVF
jgi:hypothetical protein